LLEYPHYTKPRVFRNWEAPAILFGGHHAQIERWRRKQQIIRTRSLRPDLWAQFVPNKSDLKLISEIESEEL